MIKIHQEIKITRNMTESMFLEHSNTTMTEVIDVDLNNEESVERYSLIENDNATVNYKDVL